MLKNKRPDLTDKISKKIGIIFSKIPLPPNLWTFLSILPAIFGFFVLIYKQMFLAFILFFVSGFFDAVDGAVARVTHRVSRLGGYLDGIMDRIVEGLLILGLMIFSPPDFMIFGYSTPAYIWLALLLFIGSALVSYARAYACQKRVIIDEKILNRMPGILERTERLFLIGIGMLLFYVKPIYLTYVIVIAVILSIITFLQRVFFVINTKVEKDRLTRSRC